MSTGPVGWYERISPSVKVACGRSARALASMLDEESMPKTWASGYALRAAL
jgi:hypothetical protein